MFGPVLIAIRRENIKLVWSTTRFGTGGSSDLVKEAKFADCGEFLLSAGFSAGVGLVGRY